MNNFCLNQWHIFKCKNLSRNFKLSRPNFVHIIVFQCSYLSQFVASQRCFHWKVAHVLYCLIRLSALSNSVCVSTNQQNASTCGQRKAESLWFYNSRQILVVPRTHIGKSLLRDLMYGNKVAVKFGVHLLNWPGRRLSFSYSATYDCCCSITTYNNIKTSKGFKKKVYLN